LHSTRSKTCGWKSGAVHVCEYQVYVWWKAFLPGLTEHFTRNIDGDDDTPLADRTQDMRDEHPRAGAHIQQRLWCCHLTHLL